MIILLLLSSQFLSTKSTCRAQEASPPYAVSTEINSPSPSRSLSLKRCFELADQFNCEIISANWNITIAKAAVRIAGAIPNPVCQLQAGFGPTFTGLFTGQTQQLSWTQQFLTAGKRSKKLSVARANLKLAETKLEALRFDVHNRVRRAYAEVAAAEAYDDLVEAQREIGLKLLEIAKKRFETGKAPKSEVIQANLSVLQIAYNKAVPHCR